FRFLRRRRCWRQLDVYAKAGGGTVKGLLDAGAAERNVVIDWRFIQIADKVVNAFFGVAGADNRRAAAVIELQFFEPNIVGEAEAHSLDEWRHPSFWRVSFQP